MMTIGGVTFQPHRTDPLVEYRAAVRDFEKRRYTQAVDRLEWIVQQPTDHGHSLGDVRELLARAYYHSAQLNKAEQAARAVLVDQPTNSYMLMLLGRTLERQGRADEAQRYLSVATAFGEEL